MRYLGLIAMLLLSSACAAQEAPSDTVDWMFGCREPSAEFPGADQPCWVQSSRVYVKTDSDQSEVKQNFYFQVHFFQSKKVLRVFFDGAPITLMKPVLRPDPKSYFLGLANLHVLECRGSSCCWEREISDEEISSLSSGYSLGIHWQTPESRKEEVYIGVLDAVKLDGFSASIAELQVYWEKHK